MKLEEKIQYSIWAQRGILQYSYCGSPHSYGAALAQQFVERKEVTQQDSQQELHKAAMPFKGKTKPKLAKESHKTSGE